MKPTKNLPVIALLLAFVTLMLISVSMVSASGKQSSPAARQQAGATPTKFDAFTFCANEGETCVVTPLTTAQPRPKTVRYGANSQFRYATVVNTITCNTSSFGGDPFYVGLKECRYIAMPITSFYGWRACAGEYGTCSFSGTKVVRYGANGSFFYKKATNSIACTNTAFGNPLPNTPKMCHYLAPAPGDGSITTGGWQQCATENGTCYPPSMPGTAAYGANGAYTYKTVTGQFACTTAFFGSDPIPGTTKACHMSQVDWDYNGWVRCASEYGTCKFLGSKTLAYGANDSFNYLNSSSGSVACNNTTFGNPLPNTAKACYYNKNYGQ